MDRNESDIPERIAHNLRACLPDVAHETWLLAIVAQEIVPEFQPTLDHPLYDEYLKLRIRHLGGDTATTLLPLLHSLDEQVNNTRYDTEVHATEIAEIERMEWLQGAIRQFNETLLGAREGQKDLAMQELSRGDKLSENLEIPAPLRRLLNVRLASHTGAPDFWEKVADQVMPHFVDDGFLADNNYKDYLILRTRASVLGQKFEELETPIKRQILAAEACERMTHGIEDGERLSRHFGFVRSKLMDLLRELAMAPPGIRDGKAGGSQR